MRTELKITGYCNLILDMNEQELLVVLDSFKQENYNVTLFVSDKNIEPMDMPRLVVEIKQIETALVKIEEWSDPALRNPVIQHPTIQPPEKKLLPQKS